MSFCLRRFPEVSSASFRVYRPAEGEPVDLIIAGTVTREDEPLPTITVSGDAGKVVRSAVFFVRRRVRRVEYASERFGNYEITSAPTGAEKEFSWQQVQGQGRGFATFLIGFTTMCAGIAYMSTGLGKLVLAAGAVIFVVSLFGFLKIKPLEGKPAQKDDVNGDEAGRCLSVPRWAGASLCSACTWWTVPAHALFWRLIGIGVSLFGIIYILPSTFNKNAIWKA